MANEFSSLPPDAVVLPCPLSPSVPAHWIEIELVGEDGNPIPWERFRLVLPGGDIVEGALDDKGYARVDCHTQSGECTVTFPDLDAGAVSYLQAAGPRPAG
ncbi:MAG TPA: hypothetical protein VFQ91_08305 [Bryobacteraceae bacterium]|nr:hypothetical protein [Bryobacteraceae bacterium]